LTLGYRCQEVGNWELPGGVMSMQHPPVDPISPKNLDLILIDGVTLLVRVRAPPETWTTRLILSVVLVVEDVSTTGSSPLTAAEALQEAGAEVIGVAVIVDRGGREAVEKAGFEYRAAFSLADLGLD